MEYQWKGEQREEVTCITFNNIILLVDCVSHVSGCSG